MASPVPDTSQNRGALRKEGSQVQLPRLPPDPTSPPPWHSHHSLPVARELIPIAPDRFPAPFPTLPTSTGHGCRHGELSADTGTVRVILSSVAQNTREGCAQWHTEVTQAQSKGKHFRPQNGRGTTWSLKQWGQLLTLPRLTLTDTAGPPRRRKGCDETSQTPRAVFHHR